MKRVHDFSDGREHPIGPVNDEDEMNSRMNDVVDAVISKLKDDEYEVEAALISSGGEYRVLGYTLVHGLEEAKKVAAGLTDTLAKKHKVVNVYSANQSVIGV